METVIADRFALIRELGRGGFGAVYEADVIGPPGGRVALKVLERPLVDFEEFEARFLREVKNAQRLSHPHAVRVFEYGALPDGATAPRPSRGNVQPKYPREARKAGKVGLVRLKVIITAEGHVEDIQLVEGDEPFATEALQAVKRWRYQPAELSGDTIAVRRMIEVHFKLRA